MRNPEVVARVKDLGYVPIGSTPEAYAENIRSEMAKRSDVVQRAKITID